MVFWLTLILNYVMFRLLRLLKFLLRQAEAILWFGLRKDKIGLLVQF